MEQRYKYSERIEYGSGKEILTREEALKSASIRMGEMLNELSGYVNGEPDIIEGHPRPIMYVRVPVKESYFQ